MVILTFFSTTAIAGWAGRNSCSAASWAIIVSSRSAAASAAASYFPRTMIMLTMTNA